MNASKITLLLMVLSITAAGFAVFRRPKQANPANLQIGPFRHPQLSEELVSRVRAFEPVFTDVYPNTHEQWIEGFRRDLHPENEIAIWEHIAAAYTQFVNRRELSIEVRNEAFGILLVRSGGTDEEMLYSKLKFLTPDEARKLVDLYSAPPQPIQIEQR